MDTVLYTDGHNVKVTSTQFIVGSARYLIDGILQARMSLLKANIGGAIVLLLLGIATAAAGYFQFFSNEQVNNIAFGTWILTINRLAMLIGGFFILCSVIWVLAGRNRYAVHITTAEGEKEPLISTKRDYVSQIVNALNKAIH
jgi:hypothetical protein